MSNDILNYSITHKLLEKKGDRIKESTLRFINALGSEYMGRTYLMENEQLINHLVLILKSEGMDNNCRRSSLGTIQKLSLRRRPQELLIENDLIRWTVNTLTTERDILSEYSYEYGTALLMNLSLRTLGKIKCEDIKASILELLYNLLEHDNSQVRTFVNGTLYSLLSRPVLRLHAIKLKFQDKLQHMIDISDEKFQKHYRYILNQ